MTLGHTLVLLLRIYRMHFTAEGLDAGDYAMFTSTTWWEHNGEDFEVQSDAPEGAVEKTRLGVRYPETLSLYYSRNIRT